MAKVFAFLSEISLFSLKKYFFSDQSGMYQYEMLNLAEFFKREITKMVFSVFKSRPKQENLVVFCHFSSMINVHDKYMLIRHRTNIAKRTEFSKNIYV